MISGKQMNVEIIEFEFFCTAFLHIRQSANFVIKLNEWIIIELVFSMFVDAIKEISIIVISKIFFIHQSDIFYCFFLQQNTACWCVVHFLNLVKLSVVFLLNADVMRHAAFAFLKFRAGPPCLICFRMVHHFWCNKAAV